VRLCLNKETAGLESSGLCISKRRGSMRSKRKNKKQQQKNKQRKVGLRNELEEIVGKISLPKKQVLP